MATKTKKPRRAPRARQRLIPGTESPEIPELTAAAEEYASSRDSRMEMLKEEVQQKGRLKELMEKHRLTEYRYDSRIVMLVSGEAKVKVKSVDSEVTMDGDDDDE